MPVDRSADPARDVLDRVGRLASGESPRRRPHVTHPVEPEDPPVVAVEVEGEEIPAPRRRHETVGLDAPLRHGVGAPRARAFDATGASRRAGPTLDRRARLGGTRRARLRGTRPPRLGGTRRARFRGTRPAGLRGAGPAGPAGLAGLAGLWGSQRGRLGGARRARLTVRRAGARALVAEPHLHPVATGPRERREHLRVDGRDPGTDAHGRRPHGVDALPQPRRHDLIELGERARRVLLHPGDRAAGRQAQAHRDGDRLVVVEHQRRHRLAGRQPVPAAQPALGVHGIAQLAQPRDVTTHASHADIESLGELRTGPHRVLLEQRQQPQQPHRRVGRVRHGSSLAQAADIICPLPP